MYLPRRTLLSAIALLLGLTFAAHAQTPTVYLKFDGNLTDSSGAGIVTAVTPSSGWTPVATDYVADRFGVASKSLNFSSSRSLQLVAASLVNNSNQALGLRNAAGTNTSFTLAAWIYCTNVSGGYNTVFGNLGTGAGTLHAGLGTGVAKTHFGFDNSNDANGAVVNIAGSVWYHLVFVYDAPNTQQRIYINGVPEITRTGVTNTLKAADLLLGNWSTATDASNDFRGRLDDVVVYNGVLSAAKIQALYGGADPLNLPATYSPARLPGPSGGDNFWGVREIKTYTPPSGNPAISTGTLVDADRIIKAPTTISPGVQKDYTAPVINLVDPDAAGNLGSFSNEANFATGVDGTDDNNIAMVAHGTVRITTESDYTFGFLGDDGSRLRVIGQPFISTSAAGGSSGNPAVPANQNDGICWTNGTGNSGTMGVVHLKPGDYNLELVYWEGSGGSSIEVFAAPGAKTTIDSTFQLIGNTAAGGLLLVRDPDTYPTIQSFTVNGGSSLFVNAGSPATLTLAWQTNGNIVPSTTVSIDQGVGAVATTGSTTLNSPTQTTTYTLTATNGVATATKQVTVYVNAPPVISSFTASDTTVTSATPVTLNWTVAGATSLTLDPGGQVVTGQTSRVVSPTTTTTYTLSATNGNGVTTQQVTVNVGPAPVVNSFTVADANPLYGAEDSLSWTVTGADTVSINQGLGTVANTSGTVAIVPLQTTTYVLSATNAFGTTTAFVTVVQPTPIGVSGSGFTVRRVFAKSTTPLPFTDVLPPSYLQSALTLLGETTGGPHYGTPEATSTSTTVNFADGVDGDFTGSSSYPGTNSASANYAVRITGNLLVNTPGKYTFVVNSSYGARLRIDGQDVIVDDGSHAPGDNAGSVNLTKTSVSIELISYGISGSSEVELAWIRPNLTWQLLTTASQAAPLVRNGLFISEFEADNSGDIVDEDGASSDWIEIWNSTNSTINLAGYFLTDDPTIPNQWAFPAWTLAPNQYLIVFASLKNRRPAQATAGLDNPGTVAQPHLHTNFKLSKDAGSLQLTQSNGTGGYNIVSAFNNYPPQLTGVSYGSSDLEGYIGFMEVPTPGTANAATVVDFVKDTKFDHARGRYTAPFNLVISTSTPGATIRYTTDGRIPAVNTGTVYTGPIPITKTTVVRAAAFKSGWKPTNVDTETYLFIDDVVTQTTNTATALGFPSTAVNGQVFRYGMNLTNVTSAGGNLQSLKNALTAVPTLCMSTDISNLVDPATGIYVNPSKHDLFWERPVSLEYLDAAGVSQFQINCGTRIRGGFSRSTGNPKHAFHLFFRGSLYDGSLNYKLFGDRGASTFGQIDARCEENYSWSFQNDSRNLGVREEWSRVAQADQGQPSSRTSYFHLYINGIYWGIYNWEERTEADYSATYLGGTSDTADAIKSAGSPNYLTEATDGNFAAWQTLFNQCVALKADTSSEANRTAKYLKMQGLNPDGTRNPSFPVLLDVDNLIDYQLVIFYDGSFDAPLSTFLNNGSNNWFGVRDRTGTRGFAFFTHDNEHGFDTMTQSYNRVGPWGNSGVNVWGQTEYGTRETFNRSNPQYLHELLCYSAEYRLRFADRVQKHMLNPGGALSTAGSLTRLNTLLNQMDTIIHAEAARWGSASLNRNSWLTQKTSALNFINNGGTPMANQTAFATPYPGGRTALIVTQLKGYVEAGVSQALVPNLNAPAFSGQFGGPVANPYTFSISNPNGSGAIYYTVNGPDPRAIGGGIAATAQTAANPVPVTLNSTATVRARIFDSATQTWSALTEAEYLVGSLAAASNLVISKIHYNPAGSGNLTQFIEVMNIGSQPIDLTNVQFTLGVLFEFSPGYILAPGARALIVRDTAAFQQAYPGVPANQIVGIFANASTLDTGGERLQLLDSASAVIKDFSYNNKSPWPTSPDGGGPCLVLIHPEQNPDPSNGANWRASTTTAGTPGGSDTTTYAAWAAANNVADPLGTADLDGDGLPDLLEYSLGSNPQDESSISVPIFSIQTITVNGVVSDYLTLTYLRTIGRDDSAIIVEACSDVTASFTPAIMLGSPNFNGDGTETVTYRHPLPRTSSTVEQFLRMRATRTP